MAGKGCSISLAICLLLMAVVIDASVSSHTEDKEGDKKKGFITHASILL